VLRNIAGRYLTPIASTNGQASGFLHTDVGPLLKRAHSKDGVPVRVLYLGDLDLSGGHIEENTRRVLEGYAKLEWKRIAITETQACDRNLPEVEKKDSRFKPARTFPAVETEALKQTEIQRILRRELDEILPQPFEEVRGHEVAQRVLVREALMPLHENGSAPPNPYNIPKVVVAFLADKANQEVSSAVATLPMTLTAPQRGAIEADLRRRVARRLLED